MNARYACRVRRVDSGLLGAIVHISSPMVLLIHLPDEARGLPGEQFSHGQRSDFDAYERAVGELARLSADEQLGRTVRLVIANEIIEHHVVLGAVYDNFSVLTSTHSDRLRVVKNRHTTSRQAVEPVYESTDRVHGLDLVVVPVLVIPNDTAYRVHVCALPFHSSVRLRRCRVTDLKEPVSVVGAGPAVVVHGIATDSR